MTSYKDYADLYDFLEQTSPGTSRGVGDKKDDVLNKPFAFDPNLVRTGTVRVDSSFETTNSTTRLTRGFIRNLITDQGEGRTRFPNMRCRFQFNPQDIEHAIEARKDMYLPILQDPKQLTQPMAGNASFAFELIFDRTTEVNSSTSLSFKEDNADVPDQSSPQTVGVFHDLRVLYSIIGQGLSAELMKAQEEKTRSDIAYYASRNYSELNIQVDASTGTTEYNGVTKVNAEGDIETDTNSANLAAFLNDINNPSGDAATNLSFMSNINIGNSAFLIPQPCRVIFSPMFMVDGFVMNTRVLFTKFSAKMIPIQCKVFIQMQAVYLGFAKNKTFISQQLADTAAANTDGQQFADSSNFEITKILAKNLTAINVGYSSDKRILGDNSEATSEWALSTGTNKEGSNKADSGLVYQPIWLYGTKNFWYRRPYIVAESASIKDPTLSYDPSYRISYANSITTPNFMPGLTVTLVSSKKEKDEISKKVFEAYDKETPTIKINIGARIYGPFATSAEATSFKVNKLGVTPGAYPGTNDYPTGVKLLGNYFVGANIASKEAWEDFADGPHDFLLSSTSPNSNFFNDSNQAANPITPSTTNSSNVSAFSSIVSSISTYVSGLTGTATQKSNDTTQLTRLYRASYASPQENTNPRWDSTLDGTNVTYGSSTFPAGTYNTLPDSLLSVANTVHGLNNKYFVVVTETSLEIKVLTVANAGTIPFSLVTTRVADVLQGSTINYVASARQVYPSAQGLLAGPIGSVI
jgi:hypothetical protein